MRTLFVAAISLALLPACKASINAKATTAASRTDEPVEEAPADDVEPPVPMTTEFFGVARSLTLKPGAGQPLCSCVRVVMSPARHKDFDWAGEPPPVGSDAMVVAIGEAEGQCNGSSSGPSIAAIDQIGNDVVVVLERWEATRPQALGAVIPNPGEGGNIYLRARGKSPYGRPIGRGYGSGQQLCLIGTGSGGAVGPAARPSRDLP